MPYKITAALTLMMCVVCLMFAVSSFAGTTTYIYDELNRLHEVQHGDGNGIRYGYDKIGNLESKTPIGNVFTITASATEGGIISPMGTLTITAGSSKSYSFTPLYGYSIADVVVDGVSQGAVTIYPFNNIAASHTITVNFAMNATAWIQGSVKDLANNPLADVDVQIRNAEATFSASVKTAGDGSYSLAAYAGNWLVDALTENANWSPVPEQSVTLTAGQTAMVDFTADVSAPTVSTTIFPDGIYNISYNQTLAATGGVTPYTWSITAGALPAGLNLIPSTGAITGTPATVGVGGFTAQVQGANGFTTTKNLAITISYLPIRIAGPTPVYYSSLQTAYNAAADGDTIQCRAVELTENLAFNLNKTVTLAGGYDAQFATSTGVTTIHGAVNVTAGAVPMRSVNLQY